MSKCDECGTEIINDCSTCGAPQCCPRCCETGGLNSEIARLREVLARIDLRIGRERVPAEGVCTSAEQALVDVAGLILPLRHAYKNAMSSISLAESDAAACQSEADHA